MRQAIRILLMAVLLAALLCPAAAEEAVWTFPLTPGEVDQSLLVFASPAAPLTASDVPEDLVTLQSLRVDESGNSIGGGVRLGSSANLQVRSVVVEALEKLTSDADKEGIAIYLRAAYRSYQEEDRRYKQLSRRGREAAKPGETDYQTGLAVTLVDAQWLSEDLTADFTKSEGYLWLADNAGRYGFVLRTPEGKEEITGSPWEPWHLRYVGIKPAAYMRRNGLCLEEFTEEYQAALDAFATEGGDVADVAEAELLPEGIVELEVTNPDGDNDFILFHD